MISKDVLQMVSNKLSVKTNLSLSLCNKRFRKIVMNHISQYILYCYVEYTYDIPFWVKNLYLEKCVKRRKIPPMVQYIQFSDWFNGGDLGWIPPTVVKLKFGRRFIQSLDIIPASVKKVELTFASHISEMTSVVPRHIETLYIQDYFHETFNGRMYCNFIGPCLLHSIIMQNSHCSVCVGREHPYPCSDAYVFFHKNK